MAQVAVGNGDQLSDDLLERQVAAAALAHERLEALELDDALDVLARVGGRYRVEHALEHAELGTQVARQQLGHTRRAAASTLTTTGEGEHERRLGELDIVAQHGVERGRLVVGEVGHLLDQQTLANANATSRRRGSGREDLVVGVARRLEEELSQHAHLRLLVLATATATVSIRSRRIRVGRHQLVHAHSGRHPGDHVHAALVAQHLERRLKMTTF